ncbi:hypothetical protein DFP72DRAFT_912057 [Ephemerocybe angulata]|uniref:Uncharacterized protein n=1 Tax=Ephemerocybe angulata TaxID=980116 RepID=A0A8H6HMU2_9AGAR|nr:hypothetical protein DFP72DRAFT_912057 [Tulosesus angulatus]
MTNSNSAIVHRSPCVWQSILHTFTEAQLTNLLKVSSVYSTPDLWSSIQDAHSISRRIYAQGQLAQLATVMLVAIGPSANVYAENKVISPDGFKRSATFAGRDAGSLAFPGPVIRLAHLRHLLGPH